MSARALSSCDQGGPLPVDSDAYQPLNDRQGGNFFELPVEQIDSLKTAVANELIDNVETDARTQLLSEEIEEETTFKNFLGRLCSSKAWKAYNREYQLEFGCCILLSCLGQFFLKDVIRMPINQRDIPYQITQNSGDTIINLTYNNKMIAREDQTVPSWMLFFIGFIIPLIIITIGSILYGWSMKDRCGLHQLALWPYSSSTTTLLDGHSAVCMLFIAIGSNSFFTEMIKRYAGYFRPNFYQMCEFDLTYGSNECLADVQDGRKSFPSGHSSLSFCSMLCLALYLVGKVGLFHQWQPHRIHSARSPHVNLATPIRKKLLGLLSLGGPLMLATFVAASRVHDNYHHPADVITGAVIGSACALVSYHLWYPSIFSPFAGMPYCCISPALTIQHVHNFPSNANACC